jgi:hypothetical protein
MLLALPWKIGIEKAPEVLQMELINLQFNISPIQKYYETKL